MQIQAVYTLLHELSHWLDHNQEDLIIHKMASLCLVPQNGQSKQGKYGKQHIQAKPGEGQKWIKTENED